MKKIRFIVGTVVCAATLFSAACNGATVSTEKAIEVWAKEGHVKVFADREYEEEFRRSLAVNIGVCKNEYEATQIILTANSGMVDFYNLEICDLKNADGEVLSKENIKVYNQKYINLDSIEMTNTLGTGWYPDALLPFDIAVKYGENKVTEGNNQGIYIEAYIPEETEAGVYTGDFTLTVDGKTYNVPASITVYDYAVSEQTHLASLFSTHKERAAVGEMGWNKALEKAYNETLIEFRVSPTLGDGTTLKSWADDFRTYYNLEKTPTSSTIGTIYIQVEQSGKGIDETKFRERLVVAAAASVLDGIDYVGALDTRSGKIDEPHLNDTHALVNTFIASFNQTRDRFVADLRSGVAKQEIKNALSKILLEEITDDEFEVKFNAMREELADSAAGVLCVVTTHKDSRLTVEDLSYCVTRAGSTTAKEREYYKDLGPDQWWYFCGSGMDVMGYGLDAPLLEARMIGWASYDYEYVGDVCWETVLYTDMEWSSVGKTNVESACDPYAVATRSGIFPGDGYLLYPGKPYGLKQPVTCVRLHAIRDGREEYEMLYDLEQKYVAKGYSPRSVLDVLFKDLYKDIELTANADDVFVQSRETLIELCMLANKGVFITDYEQIGTSAKATLRCEGEVKATKINGKNVAPVNVYEMTASLEGNNNAFEIAFNDASALTVSLGNKQTLLKTFTKAEDMKVVSGAVLSANTVDGISGVKVDLRAVNFGAHTISFAVNSSDITKNKTSLSLRVYNPNAKKMYVTVFLEGSGGVAIAGDAVLYPGWNTVQINKLSATKWSSIKKLSGVQLAFSLGDRESFENYDGVTVASVAVEE